MQCNNCVSSYGEGRNFVGSNSNTDLRSGNYVRRTFKVCSAKRDSFEPCLVVLEVPGAARIVEIGWDRTGVAIAYRCDWAVVVAALVIVPLSSSPAVLDSGTDHGVALTMAYSCFYRPEGKPLVYQVGRRVWAREFEEREYIAGGGGIYCYGDQFTALREGLGEDYKRRYAVGRDFGTASRKGDGC